MALPVMVSTLVDRTEERREHETGVREAGRRSELGQFFTPPPVAKLLAGMFDVPSDSARLLDPGAGVGSLTAALVQRAQTEGWATQMEVSAVEMDKSLVPALAETLNDCVATSVVRSATLHAENFIDWACSRLGTGMFAPQPEQYDLAILNPPYRKLSSGSVERRLLSALGIEATNLYSAFVALSLLLLRPGGQLVAITPRSFCNGPYFLAFRRELLASACLRSVHLFERRDQAFRDTEVLQENVVFHVVKGAPQGDVVIESSTSGDASATASRSVPFDRIVHADDPSFFIHLVADEQDEDVAPRMRSLPCALAEVNASVSTGRVVDFRVREHLQAEPTSGSVPLLYPQHLHAGRVTWPAPGGKKPNGLAVVRETERLLLPAGNYVLVKRFSSKEERKRIVACVLEAETLGAEQVAIENHLNVFHRANAGLPVDLAWGLAVFLNSSIVDVYFRQFNGHTQVNATDLRWMRYPCEGQLVELGAAAQGEEDLDQTTIDSLVGRFVPELGAGA